MQIVDYATLPWAYDGTDYVATITPAHPDITIILIGTMLPTLNYYHLTILLPTSFPIGAHVDVVASYGSADHSSALRSLYTLGQPIPGYINITGAITATSEELWPLGVYYLGHGAWSGYAPL